MAKRMSQDEDQTSFIVDFLADEQFEELYLLLREIESLGTSFVRRFKKKYPRMKGFGSTPELRSDPEWKKYLGLRETLNARLLQYRTSPQMDFSLQNLRWTQSESWIRGFPQEWVAVDELLTFAIKGQLWKIRRCEACDRWYVARVRDQRCCKTSCRQKLHASSPQFKAGRREYMREYRRLQRNRLFKTTDRPYKRKAGVR
jgi:hypothetical protein